MSAHININTRDNKFIWDHLNYNHATIAITILYNNTEHSLYVLLITAEGAYTQEHEEIKYLSNRRSLLILSASMSSEGCAGSL